MQKEGLQPVKVPASLLSELAQCTLKAELMGIAKVSEPHFFLGDAEGHILAAKFSDGHHLTG